jgi:hypothetical protein
MAASRGGSGGCGATRMASRVSAWRTAASVSGVGSCQYSRTGFQPVRETGLVAVAVLGDDRRYRVRVGQGEPPAYGCAVILDVRRIPLDAELVEQRAVRPARASKV